MKKYKLLIFVLAVAGILRAQTVDELITMAETNNPGLKALDLEYQAALTKADQVNDWPDPTVNLAIGVLPIETRLGAQRFRVGVNQMIPWKGSLNAQSDLARANAEVMSYKDEIKEIDIAFAIRTAYASLNFLEAQKDIIDNRLDILEAVEALAKSALRSGKGQLSNVLLTERKREAMQADLALLDQKMEQPTIAINRWTGRPLNTPVILVDQVEIPTSEAVLKEFATQKHPQFAMLDQSITASKSKVALTQYQVKPQIGVGLDYAYIARRKDVEIPGNGRDVFMPMGSIKIPLHTGRYDAIRQEEKIRQEAIEAMTSEYQDQYSAELESAFSTIEYTSLLMNKYVSLKEITKETLQLMRTEYAAEGTRFEELLRMEMELIDYDLQILKARYERDLATAVLYKFK